VPAKFAQFVAGANRVIAHWVQEKNVKTRVMILPVGYGREKILLFKESSVYSLCIFI